MGCLEAWRHTVVEHFGKSMKPVSKWHSLTLDVLLVDSGLKPGIIMDYAAHVIENFPTFLITAHQRGLVQSKLCIIHIGHSTILAKPVSLASMRESLDKKQGGAADEGQCAVFVDVSGHLSKPELLDSMDSVSDTVETFLALCQCCQDNSEVEVVDDGSFNPCTLFGLLCGYPIVYWFQETASEQKPCSANGVQVKKKWVARTGEGEKATLKRCENGKDDLLLEMDESEHSENQHASSSESTSDNCLSCLPLQAYVITASTHNSLLHLNSHANGKDLVQKCEEHLYEMYPFTCPLHLVGDLKPHIDLWFERISQCASTAQIFSQLQLNFHVEEHAYVCL